MNLPVSLHDRHFAYTVIKYDIQTIYYAEMDGIVSAMRKFPSNPGYRVVPVFDYTYAPATIVAYSPMETFRDKYHIPSAEWDFKVQQAKAMKNGLMVYVTIPENNATLVKKELMVVTFDPDQRRKWSISNLDLLLCGACSQEQ